MMIEKIFKLNLYGATIKKEIFAGIITFITISYIIVVNPIILSKTGMNPNALFITTCLIAGVGSLLMGFFGNLPFAIAPGMGLNAFFTYGIVLGMNKTWQVALAAVFVSGIVFLIVSLLPIRNWIISKMPNTIKTSIACGIGLFILLLGLENSGLVVAQQGTLVTLGELTKPTVLLAFLGVVAIATLTYLRVYGANLIIVIVLTIISLIFNLSPQGVSSVSSINFNNFFTELSATLFKMDFSEIFEISFVTIFLSVFLSDFFDSTGTLIGLSRQAGFVDVEGKNSVRLKRALLVDSTTNILAGAIGSSAVTTYVESASGIQAGGKTGLTAVVVGLLFFASLFLSGFVAVIPAWAVSPVLIFVAISMLTPLKTIDYEDITNLVPAILIITMIPLTFSIAHGIGIGFISYTLLKALSGKFKDLNIGIVIISIIFFINFVI